MSRLIILSGPSCAGKGPTYKALRRFCPGLLESFETLVLHNTRSPRPGEVDGEDYHFRSSEEVERLAGQDRYAVCKVWDDVQAVDLQELREKLAAGDVLYEGNPYIASELVQRELPEGVERLTIFLSPLSKAEIADLREQGVDLCGLITQIMKRRLLRRTQKQKQYLGLDDLETVRIRSMTAYDDMRQAHCFDWIVPSPDGEDSENWDQYGVPVLGARVTYRTVAALIAGEDAPHAETWEEGVLA